MEKGRIFVVGKWNLRSCLLPAKLGLVAKLVQIGVKLCECWIFASNKCAMHIKFLHDVDFNGIVVDFLITLNNGYSEISQLLFNNIHQKCVDTSQTL